MAVRRGTMLRPVLLMLASLWLQDVAIAETPAGGYAELNIDWPKERLPAPAFELEALAATAIRLSDYRGKLVLVNFWATFCAPCRKEMPALQGIWTDYADKGLVVLAIAADREGRGSVAPYITDGGYSFPVALDPDGEVRNRYEVSALPTTYLVGRDGRFVARLIGERAWDSPGFRAFLKKLLATREAN